MQEKKSFLASFLFPQVKPCNKNTARAKRGKSETLLFSRIKTEERRAQSFDETGNKYLRPEKRRVTWKTQTQSKERRHSA